MLVGPSLYGWILQQQLGHACVSDLNLQMCYMYASCG